MDFLAIIKQQVEQNLRDAQAGRERQDAGERVSGSRKEIAAMRKLALNTGEVMKAEVSPTAAALLVRKGQAFPRPDFEAWRTAGNLTAPVAGYLYMVWKTFPDQPKENTPFARMAYVRLGRDLNAFITDYASGKRLLASMEETSRSLLKWVFGFNADDGFKLGSRVNHYNLPAPTRQSQFEVFSDDERILIQHHLAALRRFVPADALMDFIKRYTAGNFFTQPTFSDFDDNLNPEYIKGQFDQADLLRLLYDFPDPDCLVGAEPIVGNLYEPTWSGDEDNRALQLRVQPWTRAVHELQYKKDVLQVMFSMWAASDDEYFHSGRYSSRQHVPTYLPRLLATYYGNSFASVFFSKNLYLPRPKNRRTTPLKNIDQGHELLVGTANLPGCAADDWDKVAKLVGLVKDPDAAPKTTGPAAPAERVPLSHIRRRGGVLITELQVHEQFLLSTLGFRAVEYGNYVRDKEGTEHLRHFVCALTDLCDVLNLDPAKINRAGGLAIAFGSRGHGGKYAAFYQPSERIINLTKSNGDGTVAHEWMHYLDHLLYIQYGEFTRGVRPYASYYAAASRTSTQLIGVGANGKAYVEEPEGEARTSAGKVKQDAEKKETQAATDAARKQINWSGWPNPATDVPQVKTLLSRVWEAIRNGYYTGPGGEMRANHPDAVKVTIAVEASSSARSSSYYLPVIPCLPEKRVIKAADKDGGWISERIKPLLALVRRNQLTVEQMLVKMRTEKYGCGSYFSLPPFSKEGEFAYMDRFFAGIARELEMPELEVTLYRPLVSTFYITAANHGNAAYWAAPWELFARSFEKFVHDEMALRKQANNYLVDYEKFDRLGSMYPQGEEAVFINQAWREFFAYLSDNAALGPFSAPWSDGVRVDEDLALGKNAGAPTVTDGVISLAPPSAGTPPELAPAPQAAPASALALAKAKLQLLALAKAKARARAG